MDIPFGDGNELMIPIESMPPSIVLSLQTTTNGIDPNYSLVVRACNRAGRDLFGISEARPQDLSHLLDQVIIVPGVNTPRPSPIISIALNIAHSEQIPSPTQIRMILGERHCFLNVVPLKLGQDRHLSTLFIATIIDTPHVGPTDRFGYTMPGNIVMWQTSQSTMDNPLKTTWISADLLGNLGYQTEDLELILDSGGLHFLVHEEDLKKLENRNLNIADDSRDTDIIVRLLHKTGKYKYFALHGISYRLPNGTLRHTDVLEDITERKVAEQELGRLIDEMYRIRSVLTAIVQTIPIGIVLVNPDYSIEFTNRYARKLVMNLSGQDLQAGGDIFRYISEGNRARFLEAFDLTGSGQTTSFELKLPVITDEESRQRNLIFSYTFLPVAKEQCLIMVIDNTETVGREQSIVGALRGIEEIFSNLVEERDDNTFEHNKRVSQTSLLFGGYLGIHEYELGYLVRGALLHDIGKAGWPDSILIGEVIQEAKRYLLESHVRKPAEWLKLIPELFEHNIIRAIIILHHCKYNGEGYPKIHVPGDTYRGLKGKEIPFCVRFYTIVDNFDAYLSDRSYRLPLTLEESMLNIIAGAGDQFDPFIAQYFLEFILDQDNWRKILPNPEKVNTNFDRVLVQSKLDKLMVENEARIRNGEIPDLEEIIRDGFPNIPDWMLDIGRMKIVTRDKLRA